MNVYEAAVTRRSIRRFQDKPVPYEVLEKCINAARLAPTGRNQQVLEFVVVNDPAVLPGMFANIGGSATMPPEKGGPRPENTPKAYTLILINKAWEEENRRRVSYYDVGMAAENIILVALEQGLGCCPILMYNEANIKPVLNIPDDYDIALVIIMGYPAESPVVEEFKDSTTGWLDDNVQRHLPKRKLADVIHHNGF